MNKKPPFIIYDAAAGSGKTFTLVKEYLKIILQAKSDGYYKYILAITFTNKAVAEMKQRIITSLMFFASHDFVNNPEDMAKQIVEETDLSLEEIQLQSKKITKHLLHHYSSFSVETIDSFNHRLIRSFAKDLKLTGNFEISLDIPKLTTEAVDQLIAKAGENPKITKILIDYTLRKIDDNKSWDIAKDIVKAAKILFNENDKNHLNILKRKSLDDFLIFIKQLQSKKDLLAKKIINSAEEVLQKIASEEILHEDFSRKTLPNHFLKLTKGEHKVYENKLLEYLETGGNALYKKTTNAEIASKIDKITPYLLAHYIAIKKLVFKFQLVSSMLKNIIPLSVINLVNQEIEIIKETQNMLPITEFNSLINNEIKNQPAPFIYERIGERYRHFFIDEFQDTSLLQWQNMIPLTENAITQQYQDGKRGSLLLVGDAKQSIYRWRGGLPEQFIALCNDENPFPVKKQVKNLPTNYRSRKEIINFNNDFFTFVANFFENPLHKELYVSGNHQNTNNKKGGYIKLEFIDAKNKEEAHEIYAQKIHQTIIDLKKDNFQEKDICILTRNKKDGITLSNYLLNQGITVVSSETLLLGNAPVVQFLVNWLTFSLFPSNQEVKIQLLDFLYSHLSILEEKHAFFSALINDTNFTKQLLKYDIDVNFSEMQSLSLYNSFEYCIRKFNLNKLADAYLYSFMDLVYEFEQKPKSNKFSFLEDWQLEKEKASIPVSDGVNGVQLMTVHKAKGLEFPVVLFPYADIDIYFQVEPKSWFPINKDAVDFKETLINYNKDITEFGEEGKIIYEERRSTLELDNVNLLYVTLTRAETQLYVFSKKPTKIKENKPTTYNQFFTEFLKHKEIWEKDKEIYEFGVRQKKEFKTSEVQTKTINPYYYSSAPESHNLTIISKEASLWDTEAEKAISLGLLLHETMELIKYEEDLVSVFEELENRSGLSSAEIETLKHTITAIVLSPELIKFFKPSEKVVIERKIISSTGKILIPDRLNFHKDNSVSIIDYKTGVLNKKHEYQINSYALALNEMGYRVSEKILIYSSTEGIVVNKV